MDFLKRSSLRPLSHVPSTPTSAENIGAGIKLPWSYLWPLSSKSHHTWESKEDLRVAKSRLGRKRKVFNNSFNIQHTGKTVSSHVFEIINRNITILYNFHQMLWNTTHTRRSPTPLSKWERVHLSLVSLQLFLSCRFIQLLQSVLPGAQLAELLLLVSTAPPPFKLLHIHLHLRTNQLLKEASFEVFKMCFIDPDEEACKAEQVGVETPTSNSQGRPGCFKESNRFDSPCWIATKV